MTLVVLVLGYGGSVRGVEPWRMAVALRTLAKHGGGRLVVSGHHGEAERLAAMAPDHDVIIEPTARTTRENVEKSLPFLEQAERIAIATDWFHGRVAQRYLKQMRPDLASRLIRPSRQWWRGTGIQLGGAAWAARRMTRHLRRRLQARRAQ